MNNADYELLKTQYNAVIAQNRELQKQCAELNAKLEKIREYCAVYAENSYIKPVLQTISEMAEGK